MRLTWGRAAMMTVNDASGSDRDTDGLSQQTPRSPTRDSAIAGAGRYI